MTGLASSARALHQMTRKTHKTCYIRTFGCQMNEHDTQKMLLLLEQEGYQPTDLPNDADLILFNTCTIREKAYHKAISEIGRSRLFKLKRKNQIIGVCGCVAQQEKSTLLKRYPHLDFAFGPDQINKLPQLLSRLKEVRTITATELINNVCDYNFLSDVPDNVESGTAFVAVSKGCNCQCTYCIVPQVRGKEVSRSSDEIINEIRALVRNQVKEVTLLGQNVTSYKSNNETLASLIRRISKETCVKRIRFTSPHPKNVSQELISEFAENEKLCPHIHLPAQSGSNAMLKRMGRGYTRERYLEIVSSLRKARPDISITSDFIAGFCKESEKEFSDTVKLLREVEYDSIFAFKYSVRPGTPAAARFKDDVPLEVKEARLEQILSFQREMTLKKNNSLVGQVEEVLVTGPDRKSSGRLMGRLANNRIVNFTGIPSLIGRIVPMRLTRALMNSMEGKCVL